MEEPRAPGALQRPALPKKLDATNLLSKGGNNKHANSILQELKAVEECKKVSKKLKKAESLIYKVTHTLRRDMSDHLLTTSAIWTLISLLRLDGGIHADSIRKVMLDAGTPGIIYDVLKTERLTGSTKQYASELSFFLCSDIAYPVGKDIAKAGPMVKFPDVHIADRVSSQDMSDALSLANSDISSLSGYNQGSSTFVPYRISENNIAKFNQIFSFDADTPAMRENKLNRTRDLMKQSPFEINKKVLNNLGFIDEEKSALAPSEDGMSLDFSDDSTINSDNSYSAESHNHASINYKLHMMQTRSPYFESGGDTATNYGSVNTQSIGTGSRTIAEMNYNLNRQKIYSKEINPTFSHVRQNEMSRTAQNQFKDTEVFKLGSLPNMNLTSNNLQSTYNQMSGPNNQMNGSMLHTHSLAGTSTPQINLTINHGLTGTAMGAPMGVGMLKSGPLQHQQQQRATTAWDESTNNSFFTQSQSQSTMIKPILRMNSASIAGNSTYGNNASNNGGSPPKGRGGGNYFDPQRSFLTGGSSITSGNMWDLNMTNSKYKDPPRGTDIPGLYAGIDPLSLNVSAGFTKIKLNSKVMDPGDEELEDNGFLSAENDSDYESAESLSEDGSSGDESGAKKRRENPYLKRQKLRYRAEKIVDYSFMKRLFVKKATVQDAQSLVHRMEDVLLLMDPTNSGFVTWEAFGRVVLALAPQHLLRADVVAFVDSQTKDIKNQVNYKEFIMSGKVLIVQKQMGKTELPVNGWLHRQKLFANDPSTYSWKAHVQWYRKRKANCVIWLMRRAKRAFKQSDLYVEAKDWLLKQAVRAMALTRLMEYGHAALHCEQIRIDAKKKLLLKVLRSRQFKLKVDEAGVFLKFWGRWAIDNEVKIVEDAKAEGSADFRKGQLDFRRADEFAVIEERRDFYRPAKEPPKGQDFSRVYIRYWARKNAQAALAARAKLAMIHLNRRYDTLAKLMAYARQVVAQQILQEECYNTLVARANRAIAYCASQDDILKSLIRKGRTALKFLIKQENALEWTIMRGKRGKAHQSRQEDLLQVLIKKGQWNLWFLNRKEHAFAFLQSRVAIGRRILSEKVKAILFLQKIPNAIKKTAAARDKAFDWLSWRGKKGQDHTQNQLKSLRRLQFMGGRAGKIKKKLQSAFVDLLQYSQYAKYKMFELRAQKTAEMARKLNEEIRRVKKKESERREERKGKSLEEMQKLCLQDAFYLLSKLYNKVSNQEVIEIGTGSVEIIKDEYNNTVLIGRPAFKRLFLTRKILPTIDPSTLDHHFDAIDFKNTGFIHFDQFYIWYLHQLDLIKQDHIDSIAESKEFVTSSLLNIMKPSKPALPKYTLDDIFTLQERGLICVMRKFAEADARQSMEDQPDEEDSTYKRKKTGDSDTESEEEEVEEIPEGDDFGVDDFGRLMAKMRITSKAGRR